MQQSWNSTFWPVHCIFHGVYSVRATSGPQCRWFEFYARSVPYLIMMLEGRLPLC